MPRTQDKEEIQTKPLPTKWQMLLEILPGYKWNITAAGRELAYSKSYLARLPTYLHNDVRFCKALEAKKAEIKENCEISVDFVIAKHRELLGLCLKKGDYCNATRNLEGLGKIAGAYKEPEPSENKLKRRAIDAVRASECRRLAEIAIEQGLLGAKPVDSIVSPAEEKACEVAPPMTPQGGGG